MPIDQLKSSWGRNWPEFLGARNLSIMAMHDTMMQYHDWATSWNVIRLLIPQNPSRWLIFQANPLGISEQSPLTVDSARWSWQMTTRILFIRILIQGFPQTSRNDVLEGFWEILEGPAWILTRITAELTWENHNKTPFIILCQNSITITYIQ